MLFLVLVFFSATGHTQEKGYIVSGEVTFSKTGDVYIKLVGKDDYDNEKDGPYGFIAKVGQSEIKKGRVPFAFKGIPGGVYGLCAFQDVNRTGKLEVGIFGPKEPWGNYRPSRPSLRAPRFDEIAFQLDKDLKNIVLEVK